MLISFVLLLLILIIIAVDSVDVASQTELQSAINNDETVINLTTNILVSGPFKNNPKDYQPYYAVSISGKTLTINGNGFFIGFNASDANNGGCIEITSSSIPSASTAFVHRGSQVSGSQS